MCGICGFYKINRNRPFIGIPYLTSMCKKMISRGPDGGGTWLEQDNCCGLGHRRLAILDLSEAASQPMTSQDGLVTLAFNGEIYNYAEIKQELNRTGSYQWQTDHSDTEVVLHAYEEWGIGCINRFRGMFAIAIWDGRCKKFYLIRDRLGIKPLYYTIEDGILIFASEIKAILAVCKHYPEVEPTALYDYLSFLTTPCEQTLFKNIKKVRPATYMEYLFDGTYRKVCYWDVWDHTHPELYNASDSEITDALISELRTSVKLRKEADVPVGVFLSGGIDSSTNAALFSEDNSTRVRAFCVGYDKNYKSYLNENQYAQKMANYCHADYREQYLTEQDLLDFVQEMVFRQDEPIADPVCMPVYYVSKLAKSNGVTVAQVGEGADELFWGYESWKIYLDLYKWNKRIPRGFKRVGLSALNSVGKSSEFYTELLRRGCEGLPIFWSGAEAFYEYDKERMISDVVSRQISGYTSFDAIRPTYERYKANAWEKSDLNWMSYADLKHRIPELLLMRVDKMSMAVSLECRVPFLDHKFVELAMSIPQKKKIEGNVNKAVLKKAVRGIIPDEIIDRKKQGFGVPIHDWFYGKLGKEVKQKVLCFTKESELFDYRYISSMFERKDYSKKLWYLYNLAMWWNEYISVRGGVIPNSRLKRAVTLRVTVLVSERREGRHCA